MQLNARYVGRDSVEVLPGQNHSKREPPCPVDDKLYGEFVIPENIPELDDQE